MLRFVDDHALDSLSMVIAVLRSVASLTCSATIDHGLLTMARALIVELVRGEIAAVIVLGALHDGADVLHLR